MNANTEATKSQKVCPVPDIVFKILTYRYSKCSLFFQTIYYPLVCLHSNSSVEGKVSQNLIGCAGIHRVSTS